MRRIVCGGYARYSHLDGDESESCTLQVQRIYEVGEKRDWFVDPKLIFVDDGYSGREMIKRPDFTRCMEVVSHGALPILISRDLDRVARGEVFAVGHVLQTFADHDTRLFEYSRDDFLRIDGENALMAAFRAYANRSEALKASTRIKDKLRARDEANDGWTSRAPYGFANARKRISDGTVGVFLERKGTVGVIVQHPDEYPVLLLIGELFLQLGSYNAVAGELNKRGISTPEGGRFWSSRTVSAIVQNPVYRGTVVRGRTASQDKGGTLTIVKSPAEAVRTYDRPELQVWSGEKLAEIDALVAKRAVTTTWTVGARKHLSSSCVRCSHCGGGLAISIGGRKKYASYTCTNAAAGGCRTLGYRPERLVDEAVVLAAGMLLTDEVLDRTKAIIRATLDAKAKIEARAVERDRLERDLERAEKRVKAAEDLLLDAEGAEREHLRVTLREQLARRAELRTAQQKLKAEPASASPEDVLATLEARVDELRDGLRKGGIEALPALEDLLGGDRLTATRREDGRWDLAGEADPIKVFYAGTEDAKVGKKQRNFVGDRTPRTNLMRRRALPA